ncbi:FtsW/RodA/SpoVE family cell cycle protein [Paenibacillus sp. CAU 1782]
MTERHLQNPLVVQFLDDVCFEIKAKEMHDDIREELLGHLDDRIEQLVETDGKSEEEAVREAIKQMGSPSVIGEGLHAVHRPKTDWGLLLLVGAMVVIAIVSLLTLKLSYADYRWPFPIVTKAIIGTAGIVTMLTLALLNYRKLLRLSTALYILTIGLMFTGSVFGMEMNGSREWIIVGSVGFNVNAMAPYFLIIAAAGMLYRQKNHHKVKKLTAEMMLLLKELVLFVLLPGFFFASAPSLASMLIYALGLTVLLAASGRFKLILAMGGSLAVLTVNLLWFQDGRFMYIGSRLTSFLRLDTDAGYATKQSIEAITSAGMWGEGWGIPSANITVPYFSSEMLFPYLVQSLGWVFGAAIIVIVLLFTARIIKTGMRLQDGYAKLLTIGLAGLFGVQFAWNIVMCLGLLPIMGFSLPLISWSPISLVEFAALGLLLSIFRRKDMMPTTLHREPA